MENKDLRVIVLGAGMAGILSGVKLQEAGITNFRIYEKADRIGGTWRENTYPGLTCDVPSHHYTFSFERNPDWSRYFPGGAEIQAYFEKVTKKYGVDEYISFNEEATRAEYRDGKWHLEFKSGLRDSADILIGATGVLHVPKFPTIAGMDDFEGELFHSARWDHSVTLDGKRIGVIGNGSTGVQLICALSGRAGHLEHYQRTAQWIMPVENDPYSDEERESFRDPEVLAKAMDFEGYAAGVNAYTQAIVDEHSDGAKMLAEVCLNNLEQSITDPVLKEKLRPDHRPLCYRLIYSPSYYQAIQHSDTSLVTEGIERIEAKGIRTTDGELHELDIIVLATGFQSDAFMRPMTMIGRNGTELNTFWEDTPKAYLAITMPDFPNFFMLNGPNGPVGNFSLIEIAEHQWNYIEQLIDRVRSGQTDEVCCTSTAMEDFERDRTEAAKKTVWYNGGCRSWYLDKRGVPASWPWDFARFVDKMSKPEWEHFEGRGSA